MQSPWINTLTSHRLAVDGDGLGALRSDGYHVIRRPWQRDFIDTLRTRLHHVLGPVSERGARRQWAPILDVPEAVHLLCEVGLDRIASEALGRDVFGTMVDANRLQRGSEMHSDALRHELSGVRFNIYLTPVVRDRGAPTIWPGSHEVERWRHYQGHGTPNEPGGLHIELEPGDVLAMDLRTWHHVESNATMREFCSIFYYSAPTTMEEEMAARESVARNQRFARSVGLSVGRVYPARVLEKLPKTWVAWLSRLGFLESSEGRTSAGK